MHRDLDISKYSGVSVNGDVYTFPLWNLVGEMVGYQQYRANANKERKENPKDMRYFTYMSRRGTNTAWGLEALDTSKRYCVLVEGAFDAVKLHNSGINALAVLANNPKPLRSWLRSWGFHLVAICDGDAAGEKLATLGDTVEHLPKGFDVGDLSAKCVEQMFGKYAC